MANIISLLSCGSMPSRIPGGLLVFLLTDLRRLLRQLRMALHQGDIRILWRCRSFQPTGEAMG